MNLSQADQSIDGTLDELDFVILAQLQQDGRRSFTDMAKQLGASVSTIRTRARKFIEDKRYRSDQSNITLQEILQRKVAGLRVNQVPTRKIRGIG